MDAGLYAAAGGYENAGPGESIRLCSRSREVVGECVGRENASCVDVSVRFRLDGWPELDPFCPPKNEEMELKKDIGARCWCYVLRVEQKSELEWFLIRMVAQEIKCAYLSRACASASAQSVVTSILVSEPRVGTKA